ncbi:hypothetical protein NESM_000438300 [Novymonas esmeraldas]|uniref:Uncharacterized protein n=1 Tax=Novymonas esmeraldas TaxID=1808958 RepID=A0AAW0ENU4_9TRYP
MASRATPAPKTGPEKSTSPNKDAAKVGGAASSAPPVADPSTATTKGSRRAQGWHTAVGSTTLPPASGANQPALDAKVLGGSRTNSGIARRSSVQFSKDALDNQSGPRTPKPRVGASRDDAADFRQSMADFLTVMYGDKTASGAVGAGAKGGAGEPGASRPAPLAGRAPPPPLASPRTGAPGNTGPLTKGLTANSGAHPQGDRIDTLVESLVRAYSRRAISARGDLHSSTAAAPDDEAPITYQRPRQANYRRAVASPRLSHGGGSAHDNNEVSVFVSQAMDNILGPGGMRGGQGLSSNRSILSSLGLDKNLFNLMQFQTHSSLQNVVVEGEDSDTVLEPMYVGEQALFRSVGTRPNMNDVSVSKSMRGFGPPAPPGTGKDTRLNATLAPLRGASGGPHPTSGGPTPAPPKAAVGWTRKPSLDSDEVKNAAGVGARGSSGKGATEAVCMSLDSKALGRADGVDGDADDSWGEVPATGSPAKATDSGGRPPVVSSARSLLDYSKARASAAVQRVFGALLDEEQLKRDVVIAVEHQLRGYITSLEREEGAKRKSGGGPSGGAGRRRGSNGGSGAGGESSATAAPSVGSRKATVKPATSAGSTGGGSGRGTAGKDAAPLMQNVLDFLQESAGGANLSNTS